MKVRIRSVVLVTSGVVALSASLAHGQATTTSTAPTATKGTAATAKAVPKPHEQSASAVRPAGECLPPASGGTAPTSAAINPAITLEASPATPTRNFGSSRKHEEIVFTLATTTPLPDDIEKRLELVADPIARVGDKTDSVLFPEPTFSDLRVSQNRKRISFRVCLDPAPGLPAGKYVGTIRVEGPLGVESTPMTVTANAKDGEVFWLSAAASLFFAFVILLYKGGSDERTRRVAKAEKLHDADLGQTRQTKIEAAEAKPEVNPLRKVVRRLAIRKAKKLPGSKDAAMADAQSFWSAAGSTFKDPAWFVGTLFAVGGVLGALWGVYDANPSWGEAGPVTSAFAIVGAGLAAIGAKTIFTGAK